jgi:hypothetical protein
MWKFKLFALLMQDKEIFKEETVGANQTRSPSLRISSKLTTRSLATAILKLSV